MEVWESSDIKTGIKQKWSSAPFDTNNRFASENDNK
jgi:hypothetical protein